MPVIGVFLASKQKMTRLDDEGIGRFTARIVQGLLAANERLVIRVVADKGNAQNVQQLLQAARSTHPTRLFFDDCDPFSPTKGINWVNQHVQVDTWFIPYVGLELALQLNQPFILCLHDLVHTHFQSMYVSRFPDYFDRFDVTVQSMTSRAAVVVFSSNFTRGHEGKSLRLPASKTEVIRLAAPSAEYRHPPLLDEATLRNKYHLWEAYLVYPSAIRLHKNHPRLIEAFLRHVRSRKEWLPPCHLVLTDHYMNSPLKSEISSLLKEYRDVADNVMCIGRIPAMEVPSLYKYAMGTIVPTLFEGSFPFQILESLLMDTPVAFSLIAPVQELLTDMSAFPVFDPFDVEQMEVAISGLLKPPPALLERQKTAISPLLSRTWTDVAMEYLVLAERVSNSWSSNHPD